MLHFYDKRSKTIYPIIGFLIGIVAFIIIYGVKILNPFYVDWLLGRGDLSQHYLGWEFYRKDIWRFPIGMTNRLAYPIETSVIFTDSIPILAAVFKVFNGILPQYFQYFGWWGLLCFGMQGYFGAKILNVWNIEYRCAFIGDVFIVLSPVMIYRMFMHTSLGGQWIILAAIYLFLRHDNQSGFSKKEILYWTILGFLIGGVHLYFFPMCFLFVAGSIIDSVIKNKRVKLIDIIPAFSFVIGTCCTFYILGGFTSHASGNAEGLGSFGFNLNAFFNGNDFSRVLPDFEQCGGGQHEGFAYLGLGIICMVVVCMVSLLLNLHTTKKSINENIVLVIIGIISFLLAVLPTVTYGGKVLLDIKLPKKVSELYAVFRTTGRFIWPTWYLIVLYCIKGVAGFTCKKVINVYILVICLLIQIFDISQALISRHEGFSEEIVYEYVNDYFWQKLSEYRNFRCVCFSYLGENIENCIQIGALALKYGWTMNAFYFARNIDGMWNNESALEHESPKSDCIYVFLPEQQELLQKLENELRYYHIGELVIGVTWLDEEGKVNDFSYE